MLAILLLAILCAGALAHPLSPEAQSNDVIYDINGHPYVPYGLRAGLNESQVIWSSRQNGQNLTTRGSNSWALLVSQKTTSVFITKYNTNYCTNCGQWLSQQPRTSDNKLRWIANDLWSKCADRGCVDEWSGHGYKLTVNAKYWGWDWRNGLTQSILKTIEEALKWEVYDRTFATGRATWGAERTISLTSSKFLSAVVYTDGKPSAWMDLTIQNDEKSNWFCLLSSQIAQTLSGYVSPIMAGLAGAGGDILCSS
ncbi:uncharacterized protein SPPG_08267 [Spizellomyces punctatus DAOM BR117]|uniref:Uncharacterized protein n=1 Tax=Spizellomyces punctatus (strain DAOM BR117) TaxID=645134 RepID=A0A0L0H568_SPIPD|nr:uncharacterized protein SPPG_08267 [Spizellomyces punctatus DAOM BR117]KNC96367.1 hypothetical protein SPPG_08267 [Spizellomyces punctatus DAOM BR117]|eukprot:XP_016604407.1 hypothetical protein SPPG_08267 [Spizellomyces punctatus DAOM BR117]